MKKLKSLLVEKKQGGVYQLVSDETHTEIEKTAKAAKLAYFHIEGKKIEKKEQFLNHASVAMHFPEYFGGNWDAFADCLEDLSWHDAPGYVVLFDHYDGLASHAHGQFDTLLEIFHSATEYWKEQEKPMVVLLRGKPVLEGIEKVG
ncbi:MAG: barstar family protein [Burkholderiales bacterium]